MVTRISSSVTLTSATIFLPLSNVVIATISDSDHSDTASDFSASINWGDGSAIQSGLTIVGLGNGLFDVVASHTYVNTFNPATLSLNISAPGSITLTPSGSVTVVDNVTPNIINIEAGADQMFDGIVAVFTDSIPNDPSNIGDLSAAINWGDGSAIQAATVVSPGNGLFDVEASHIYTSGGPKNVSVTMTETEDEDAFETAATGFANVMPPQQNPPPAVGTTADMIMNNPSNGDYEIYDIGGNAILAAYTLGQVGAPWSFVGLGTFLAGDSSDMLLRNSSTGAFEAYYVNANYATSSALVGTVGLNWDFAGTGDFDGQSSLSELLLRNSGSGSFELYQVAGGGVLSGSSVAAVGNNFTVEGFGNFSEASTTQMMMQGNSGASLGQLELYTYNSSGAAFSGIDVGNVGSNLTIVGMADLLGNGSTQMVMQQNNGNFWLYTYQPSTNSLSGTLVGAIGSNFHVVGFGQLGTSGQDEMLMQDAAGAFEAYEYSASENAFVGTSMGAVGAPWVVDGIAADPRGGGGTAVGASTAQLVQGMASIGGGAAVSTVSSPIVGAEPSQPTLLTTSPHT